jgi:hypothetical protein
LDVNNGYSVVGNFFVGSGAFDDHGGAGMEADCDGNLLMVNQTQQIIYKVESGEGGTCAGADVPWLSEDPTEGVVPAGPGGQQGGGTNPFPVTVSFDSAGLFPGLRQASLNIKTDTPYPVDPIAVDFTVRFLDVPLDVPPGTNTFENFIYGAAGANIMHGCSFFNFCPDDAVTRADMAGYIWRGIHGAFASPPAYGDLPGRVLRGLQRGLHQGCGINKWMQRGPAVMPQFLHQSRPDGGPIEKAIRGIAFVPPPCIFRDVVCR